MNYQLSTFFVLLYRLIESHPPYFKNRRDPRRSLLTGEIGVRRRGYPGQIKQQTGSPKVKRPKPAYAGLANKVVPVYVKIINFWQSRLKKN